jgi:hypothetical protein
MPQLAPPNEDGVQAIEIAWLSSWKGWIHGSEAAFRSINMAEMRSMTCSKCCRPLPGA